MSLNTNTAINPLKKTYAAVHWAVTKVNVAHSWAIQKMGGIVSGGRSREVGSP